MTPSAQLASSLPEPVDVRAIMMLHPSPPLPASSHEGVGAGAGLKAVRSAAAIVESDAPP